MNRILNIYLSNYINAHKVRRVKLLVNKQNQTFNTSLTHASINTYVYQFICRYTWCEMQTNVQETKRLRHYTNKQKILLVGEGDFSFSLSLARAFGSASNLTATSLDTQGNKKS